MVLSSWLSVKFAVSSPLLPGDAMELIVWLSLWEASEMELNALRMPLVRVAGGVSVFGLCCSLMVGITAAFPVSMKDVSLTPPSLVLKRFTEGAWELPVRLNWIDRERVPRKEPSESRGAWDASSRWIKVDTSLSMASESEGRLAGDAGVGEGDSGFFRFPANKGVCEWKDRWGLTGFNFNYTDLWYSPLPRSCLRNSSFALS